MTMITGRTTCRVALLACILLVFTIPLVAQQVGATITGTVTDSSGAVIPSASVVLTNEASGDTRRSQSNAEGFFTFVAVPPASYKVSVSIQGFNKWESTGIVLNPGDRRNIAGIILKPGAMSETVEVVAAAETITPVDSGEKAALIGRKELQNVSIVGRNAAEFIKILPGMAYTSNGGVNRASYTGEAQGTGSGPVGNFSANGQRSGALDITADGAHIIDPGCNCGQAVNTTVDMMQEVKVLTSNFGAENAKGPVVITAIGKSGGRDFHGDAYLYARHFSMNANDALSNAAGHSKETGKPLSPRPETKYFYPGGTIGGPVILPWTDFNKNRDKMFFHLGFEVSRQTVDNGIYRAFVPTMDMRQGLFSQASLDAYRGSSYIGYSIQNAPRAEFLGPDGKVLSSKIDKRGQTMINLYPKPNADPKLNGGMNYISNLTRKQNMWQFRPRVDYSFSDSLKLYVTYNRQGDSGNSPNGLDTLWWRAEPAVPYPTPLEQSNASHMISANLTKVFSPTLTNEFIFTYTYLNLPNRFANPSAVDRTSLGLDYKTIWDHPKEGQYIPSMTGWSNGIANMIQTGGFEFGDRYAKKLLPTIQDNVAKVWGTHTSKFGFYFERVTNEQPDEGYVNGMMQFADWVGGSSGNAYADMLMGGPFTYNEQNFNTMMRMNYDVIDGFAQDSWKVTRRLTIDGGIRFSHLSPWRDTKGFGFAVWVPSAYSNDPADVNKFTGVKWNKIDPSIPLSGSKTQALFINPRVGFAWDVMGNGSTVLRGGFGVYRWHDEQNVVAKAMAITRGSFDYSIPNSVTLDQIGNYGGEFKPPSNPTLLDPTDSEQPRTMSYSFTISRRLPWKSLFEVAYVGNKTDYMSNWNNSFNKPNFMPIGTLLKPGIWSLNIQNTNQYRPYKNYGADLKIITHEMYSNYNSLQASWNKQAGNITWMANYTFSKSLGIRGEGGATVGDPTNFRNSYGVLPNDRTHVFNIAYVIETPKLATSNMIAKGLLNGWQISGISQVQSGVNLQANFSSNLYFSGYYPVGTKLPNGEIVGPDNPDSQYHRPGLSNTNLLGTPDVSLMPRLTCDPRKGLKDGQFVNGSCFAPPTFGANGSFNWPYLRGPAFINHDLSVFKNFDFSEGKRLQFRMSAFNFLNHALTTFLANDQNLTLSFDQDGKLTTAKRFGYPDNRTGHRLVQLAVKYTF